MRAFLFALCLALSFTPAPAVEPDEMLKDPALESRARDLSAGLRCLICQNQSIDDSNASLAKDLRILIRERITSGDSDKAVIDYVVGRYGEFVLLRPRFTAETALLWVGPFAILLIGGLLLLRRRAPASNEEDALNETEQRALEKRLENI